MAVISQMIRTFEPDAAIEWSERMDTLLGREVSRQRTALAVTTAFALIAILLAAVGVYGVMSYDVRSQRQDLAVRSALGAGSARLFRTVLWRSLLLSGAGALIGVLSAVAVTHTVSSLLFEVGPLDFGAFAAGAGTLLAIVLAVSCVPARRAARVDPLVALRYE
jgi:putative ABC transport system permease protein